MYMLVMVEMVYTCGGGDGRWCLWLVMMVMIIVMVEVVGVVVTDVMLTIDKGGVG